MLVGLGRSPDRHCGVHAQENALLRQQHAEAERRSSAAELRQRVEGHKQASDVSTRLASFQSFASFL
jgi:hypothetical protein